MEIGIALVGGIILGWVIEWIIDWLYWRKDVEATFAAESQSHRELELARQEIVSLRSRLPSDDVVKELEAARLELDALREQTPAAELTQQLEETRQELFELQSSQPAEDLQAKLDVASQEAEELRTKLEVALAAAATATVAAAPAGPRRDNLEEINGIGPVYEQKLFDADILTFAQLAASSPEQLEQIIQPEPWRAVDFNAWIEEARDFASVVVVDLLPYRLEEIKGIGPVYVRKLNAAGIITFADLAKTPVSRLREVIEPKRWQALDFADWVAQAKEFDAIIAGDRPPLALEQIVGIGPVFATKLDAAGVKSFADFAAQSPEAIAEIIGRKNLHAETLDDWIAQARRLAGVAEPGAGLVADRTAADEAVADEAVSEEADADETVTAEVAAVEVASDEGEADEATSDDAADKDA